MQIASSIVPLVDLAVGGRPYHPRSAVADWTNRLVRCIGGLALFGLGIALILQADLGAAPWDVFHQGVSELTGISIGIVIVIVGVLLLLLWIPLRQRPGVGTLLNAVADRPRRRPRAAAAARHRPARATRRCSCWRACSSIAIGSGLYIGSGLGAGPRDGHDAGPRASAGISVRVDPHRHRDRRAGGRRRAGRHRRASAPSPSPSASARWCTSVLPDAAPPAIACVPARSQLRPVSSADGSQAVAARAQ